MSDPVGEGLSWVQIQLNSSLTDGNPIPCIDNQLYVIFMKPTGPTNPITLKLIAALEKQSKKEKTAIWANVADRLKKYSRRIPGVNLGKLEQYCEKGDTVLIPGKLLASGPLTKAITVISFKASAAVKKRVEDAGGKVMTIQELMKRNAKGSKVRIMG